MKTNSISLTTPLGTRTTAGRKLHPKYYRWLGKALNFVHDFSPKLGGQLAFGLLSTPKRIPLKVDDRLLLENAWPLDFSDFEYSVKGYVWGDGPAILLLHGWQTNATRWRAFIPRLVEAGYSVIAIDAPAHGRSKGTSLTLLQYIEVAKRVLDTVPPLHAIIGHSLGAMAGVIGLSQSKCPRPHKMVLLGTFSSPKGLLDQFANYLGLKPRLIESIESEVKRLSGKHIDQLELTQHLTKSQVDQIQIIHDQFDRIAPVDHAYRLAAALENPELVITEGCGHRLLKPRVVDTVIDFIQRG